MSSRERRIDARVNIRVPLRFRLLNNPGSPEQTAESENISQRGIYFATNFPLKVGALIEVFLKMPQGLMGDKPGEVKCMGRVVHIRPDSFLGGKAGVGLHIEQYEPSAATTRQLVECSAG